MRSIGTILLVLVFLLPKDSSAQESGLWHTQFEPAAQQAKTLDRPILMVFSGTDWCANCARLQKEVWTTASFVEYARNELVLLEIDFPSSSKRMKQSDGIELKEELIDKYNPQGVFPFMVLLSKDLQVLGKSKYVPSGPEAYINIFEGMKMALEQ